MTLGLGFAGRRWRHGRIVLATLMLAAALPAVPAYAAESEQDYRKRIATLEARVDQLERMVNQLTARPRPAAGADLPRQPRPRRPRRRPRGLGPLRAQAPPVPSRRRNPPHRRTTRMPSISFTLSATRRWF